jgi:ankyrin repeat protein
VKARWQNTTYQLVDVQTDLRVPDDRFALDLRDNTIPELAEMQISRWWPNTRLLGITDELLLTAETKPPSVFTAARRGDLQILKELVSEENLDQKDSRGLTSLWIAAAYGKTNIVDFLLSKGADLKVKAQISGLTPLHIAALNGQKDVVELLLAKGVDINARTTAGETPLRLALRRGYKEVAALLREHGAKE